MRKLLFAGIIGGIMAYFLDPKKGSQRRGGIVGSLGSATKGLSNQVQAVGGQALNQAKSTGSQAASAVQSATHSAQSVVKERVPAKRDNPNPDDLTLRDRVESQIFSDTETSRENININVIDGIVEVRGQLPQSEIDALVQRIKSIADVKGVHSYLHTPGTPAPNKESVLEVS